METMHHIVVPAVKVTFEAENSMTACEGSCQSNRQQSRFGPGVNKSYALGRWNEFLDKFGPLDVQRMVVPEMRSAQDGFVDCGHDVRVSMSQQQGAVSPQEINILIPINIPFATAFSAFDVQRDRFKMSKIVAHSATQYGASPLEPVRGLRPFGCIGVNEISVLRHTFLPLSGSFTVSSGIRNPEFFEQVPSCTTHPLMRRVGI
jgi:hypothetical protein